MRRLPKYALIAAGTLLVAVVVPPVVLLGDRVGQVRDRSTAQLPGLSLTLERRFAHPFLAEYERSLTAEQDGAGTTELKLGMDTGGMTSIKVCRSRTGSILVHDAFETYEITRGETRPSLVSVRSLRHHCSEFLGVFDVDAQKNLGFGPG